MLARPSASPVCSFHSSVHFVRSVVYPPSPPSPVKIGGVCPLGAPPLPLDFLFLFYTSPASSFGGYLDFKKKIRHLPRILSHSPPSPCSRTGRPPDTDYGIDKISIKKPDAFPHATSVAIFPFPIPFSP